MGRIMKYRTEEEAEEISDMYIDDEDALAFSEVIDMSKSRVSYDNYRCICEQILCEEWFYKYI